MLSRSAACAALLVFCACSSTPPAVTPVTCTEPTRACGGECVDAKLDSRHCGACGQACPMGYACADSTCYPRECGGVTCPEAQVCLGTTCTDRACFGVTCDPARLCAKGSCVERNCSTMQCAEGQVCDQGACVDAACFGVICPAGAFCTGGRCEADTCTSGVKDGRETGADCGGPCKACPAGQGCVLPADCQSLVCSAGVCQAASCTDSARNGGETDIDCGGTNACARCPVGGRCASGSDCSTLDCAMGACAQPSCTDLRKNGDESDTDCGGSCGPCGIGAVCLAGSDCTTTLCALGRCAPLTCGNAMKDGLETDVDCGGTCTGCAGGKNCAVDGDCASMRCTLATHTCATPSCTDLLKNGAETDTDCGGGTCPVCAVTAHCLRGADCITGVCRQGQCAAPTCSDGVKNGTETDVDCGGPGMCPRCKVGSLCTMPNDCGTMLCSATRCALPPVFQVSVSYPLAPNPLDIGIGDLDDDGNPDLAVGSARMWTLSLWYGNANGTLEAPVSLGVSGSGSAQQGPYGIGFGDVDGDGIKDIVTARPSTTGSAFFGSFLDCWLTVFRGTGGRAFAGPVDTVDSTAGNSGCGYRVSVARLNADTRGDIVISDSPLDADQTGARSYYNYVPGNGDSTGGYLSFGGAMGATMLQRLRDVGQVIAIADFDGNGALDIASRSGRRALISVVLNDGGGGFGMPLTLATAAGDGDIAAADINGDGKIDLAWTARQGTAGEVGVALGAGNGSFVNPRSYPVAQPDGVVLIDADNDGKKDLVVGGLGLVLLRGVGDGTFEPPVVVAAQLGDVKKLVSADFNKDNKPDIAAISMGQLHLLLNIAP